MKAFWHERYMRGLIQRFLNGGLSDLQAAQVIAHLERCAACRHVVRHGKESERVLREACPVRQELSDQAAQALLSRALTQTAASRRGTQHKRVIKMTGALAATVLAGCWLFIPHFYAATTRVNSSDMAVHSVRGTISPHQSHSETRQPVSHALTGTPSGRLQTHRNMPIFRHVPSVHKVSKWRITQAFPSRHPVQVLAQRANGGAGRQHQRMVVPAALRSPNSPALLVRAEEEPDFPALPPGGHLLVTVSEDIQTGREETTPRNSLSLQVTQGTAETSDSATVAAHDIDAMGTLVWTQCTIQRHNTGEVTTRIATTWETPEKQLAGLIVTTTTPTLPLSTSSVTPPQSKADGTPPALPH